MGAVVVIWIESLPFLLKDSCIVQWFHSNCFLHRLMYDVFNLKLEKKLLHRLMEMAVSPTATVSLLQRAVTIGPALVNTLRILDGEGCKLVAK